MSDGFSARVEELFAAASEMSEREADAFLADRCSAEPEVVARVVQLLNAYRRAEARGLLEEPMGVPPSILAEFETDMEEDRGQVETRSMTNAPKGPIGGMDPPDVFRDTSRFRALRPFARGGLGDVSVAMDCELNREVALKRIRTEVDNPVNRQRFTREANITGHLEHPSIVPVYGFGHNSGGQPYYAMRLIRGESLNEAIVRFHRADARPDANQSTTGDIAAGQAAPVVHPHRLDFRGLAFRRLLEQFIDVCNAIAYAHDQNVAHRDLKPENIMLGKYGETLVVDWGLAKQLDASDDLPSDKRTAEETDLGATLDGTIMGSLGYMSPEQACGDWAQVDRHSDIYSLGAILFEILAGQAPNRVAVKAINGSDARELRAFGQRLKDSPVPSAAHVKPSVPHELDSICKRALSRSVPDRFGSAAEIRTNVEAWLANDRVPSHRYSPMEAASLWIRRHPGLSGMSLVLVLVLAIGGVLLSTSIERARSSDRVASEMTRLADERFHNALSAHNSMISAVEDELSDTPGTQEMRRRLLSSPIAGLQDLLANAEETKGAGRSAIWARLLLSRLLRSEVGDLEQARRLLQTNLDDLQVLLPAGGADNALERLHFDTRRYLLLCRRDLEGSAAVEPLSQQLHDVASSWYARAPSDDHARRARVESLIVLSDLAFDRADAQQGYAYLEEATQFADRLRSSEQVSDALLHDIGTCHNRLGIKLTEVENWDAAEKHYLADLQIGRELHGRDGHRSNAIGLAATLGHLGNMYRRKGDFSSAEEYHREAVKFLTAWCQQWPDDIGLLRQFADSQHDLGLVLRDAEKSEEAVSTLRDALELEMKLADFAPQNLDAATSIAKSHLSLGKLEAGLGNHEASAELLREAVRNQKLAVERAPREIFQRNQLAGIAHEYASVLVTLDHLDEASAVYHDAAATYEDFLGLTELPEATSSAALQKISFCKFKQANFELARGQDGVAKQLLLESKRILEELGGSFAGPIEQIDALLRQCEAHEKRGHDAE